MLRVVSPWRENGGDLSGRTHALKSESGERERAERELRQSQEHLERRVAERTSELTVANGELSVEIAAREQAQRDLEAAHTRLIDASRLAGMAEVTTNVLHNVGNGA